MRLSARKAKKYLVSFLGIFYFFRPGNLRVDLSVWPFLILHRILRHFPIFLEFLPAAQRLGLMEVFVILGKTFLNFHGGLVVFVKTFTSLVVLGKTFFYFSIWYTKTGWCFFNLSLKIYWQSIAESNCKTCVLLVSK